MTRTSNWIGRSIAIGAAASLFLPAIAAAATRKPDRLTQWALDYTKGSAGAAKGKNFTIGYINQEGGVPEFPEATSGMDAATKFINAELGGLKGRKIVLKKCFVKAEDDGQKCALEMLNDKSISFVMTGTLVSGNRPIFETLKGKKPVIIGSPVTASDFSAEDAFAFTPGSPGVVSGMALFALKHITGVTKVAAVHSDNPAGKVAAEALLKPVFEKGGVTDVTLVAVADTAGSVELASAIQASGAEQADVFVPLVSIQGCIATYDALKSLDIEATVVTTGLCSGAAMTAHLKDLGEKGDVPDGWFYGGYGYSYFIPDYDSGIDTYVAKVKQYGAADVDYSGFAGTQFANLLTMAKFVNQIGPDKVTPDTIRSAAKGFAGPMMMVAGPKACGANPVFQSLCGTSMGVQQYKDTKWLSVADGYNEKFINPYG